MLVSLKGLSSSGRSLITRPWSTGVSHVGEVFHPVEIVVIPEVAVHQFHFAVRTSEDIDLG